MGQTSHQFQHWVYSRAPSNISWLGEQWEVLATAGRGLVRSWCFGNSPSFALQTIQILVVLTVPCSQATLSQCIITVLHLSDSKWVLNIPLLKKKKIPWRLHFGSLPFPGFFFFFLRGDTPSPLKYYWELTFSLKLLPHQTPEENDILVSLSTVKCFKKQP